VGKPSLNAAQSYANAKGRVFLLVLAYPGCPATKAVKWLLLLLLLIASRLAFVYTRNYDILTDVYQLTQYSIRPEAVVVLDALAHLRDDSILGLPGGLVVRKITPFHEVPQ